MDILRLALERCRTATEAIDCMDHLLSRYGQGGPAGYRDKSFRYDSSFIIADGEDMRFMGRAGRRRACSLESLAALQEPNLPQLAAGLRRHASDAEDFAHHGNADICMHAGGLTRPNQTTASMLTALRPREQPEIYVTGTSAPCLSLFQPVSFESLQKAFANHAVKSETGLWERFEPVHQRALLDLEFRRQLAASRDALETRMFDTAIPVKERRAQALDWHREWTDRAAHGAIRYRWYSAYDRFWRAKRSA